MAFASKFVDVAHRVEIGTVVTGLRSPLPCCLLARGPPQLLEAPHALAGGLLRHLQSHTSRPSVSPASNLSDCPFSLQPLFLLQPEKSLCFQEFTDEDRTHLYNPGQSLYFKERDFSYVCGIPSQQYLHEPLMT